MWVKFSSTFYKMWSNPRGKFQTNSADGQAVLDQSLSHPPQKKSLCSLCSTRLKSEQEKIPPLSSVQIRVIRGQTKKDRRDEPTRPTVYMLIEILFIRRAPLSTLPKNPHIRLQPRQIPHASQVEFPPRRHLNTRNIIYSAPFHTLYYLIFSEQ